MPDPAGEPLVSVVVATLDRPEHLVGAVQSVREQTYANVELIVVDDSERPNERLHSRSFEDLVRFEYVHRGEPKGLASARNCGIERADGDLIAFLDDDDRWTPEKTGRQVATMERSRCGLCTCWRYMVEADGTVRNVAGADLDDDVTRKLLARNVVGPPSGVVVTRETLARAGRFDEAFDRWEDREWYLRASQVTDVGCIEEPLVYYAIDAPAKMSGSRTAVRNETYPKLLAKHADVLEALGPLARREIRGWRHHKLGLMAVQDDDRVTGASRAVRAVATYPFAWPFYRLLVRSILGADRYATAESLLGRSNRHGTPGRHPRS